MSISGERLLHESTQGVTLELHGNSNKRNTKKFFNKASGLIEQNSPAPDLKGEQIQTLEKWLVENADEKKGKLLDEALDASLKVYQAAEKGGLTQTHLGIPGHDIENVIHATVSALKMIDASGGKLGNYAIWELLISSVNENMGRLMEGDDFTHQVTGFLLARQAINIFNKEGMVYKSNDENLTLISKRVMTSIHAHGGKNNGDPIQDLVRQSNRHQMCEPYFLRRSLEYDCAQVGQAIISPIEEKRAKDISHTVGAPEISLKTSTSMDWGEFYMRNLFAFEAEANKDNPEVFGKIMKENQKIANDRRANSVAYLLIMSGGTRTRLGKQTFTPELGIVDEKNLHWSKRKLPAEIYEEGVRRYNQFRKEPPQFPGLSGLDDRQQVEVTLRTMSSFLPKELLDKVYGQYDSLDPKAQSRLVKALRFSLQQYYIELDKEISLLDKQTHSDNPHVAKVAAFALDYLKSKPRLDKETEKKNGDEPSLELDIHKVLDQTVMELAQGRITTGEYAEKCAELSKRAYEENNPTLATELRNIVLTVALAREGKLTKLHN